MTNPYVEFVLEHLAPLGDISSRRMFGGHAIYCDGVLFAMITSANALYLKVDDKNRPAFESRGLAAFKPFEGSGVMPYYAAPPEIFEDAHALLTWGRASIEAGRRAQAKKKPMKRRPPDMGPGAR